MKYVSRNSALISSSYLLRLHHRRIELVICILGVNHIWISPELILVIGCFKQHRVAYLRMSLLFSPMSLKSFPHLTLGLRGTIVSFILYLAQGEHPRAA
jgi:hypothetical protein